MRAGRSAILGLAVIAGLFVLYELVVLAQAIHRTPAVIAALPSPDRALAAVSERRIAMLLAVEDPGFATHRGIDVRTPGQGMTSLTQSLVKLLYFERFEPGFAKIEQSLIARFALDPAMDKRTQIGMLLTIARFGRVDGRPVIGFADAARTYFDRELRDLDDRQFLALVAMLLAPRDLDPLRHPAANAERVRRIEAMLAGRCKPAGLRDVTYTACAARPPDG